MVGDDCLVVCKANTDCQSNEICLVDVCVSDVAGNLGTGAGNTDTGSGNQPAPVCAAGTTQHGTERCGPNNMGYVQQVCQGGMWTSTQNCLDDDVCTNGETRPGTEPCDQDAGTLDQKCGNGQWEDSTTCRRPPALELIDENGHVRTGEECYAAREIIRVRYYIPEPSAEDWIGVYDWNAENEDYLDFEYTIPNTNSGMFMLVATETTGSFQLRLFFDNGYDPGGKKGTEAQAWVGFCVDWI